ncbi:MAG: phage tail protein [Methylococcaceae bacterium]
MAEVIDYYRSYHFLLDCGGEVIGGFTTIELPEVSIETIPFREGGGSPSVRKLVGKTDYGDVFLKFGLTNSTQMWDWLMTAVNGNVERKNVSIILKDKEGKEEVTRWNLDNAWPCKWKGAQLDAMANEVAIESLSLAHEGITRA